MEPLSAVILAGGAGTRLRERVPGVPKPLAPVGGRPFLAYVLDRLVAAGIRRIVLAIGHQADAVLQAFGARYADAELLYSVETTPLGTGGALLQALQRFPSAAVLALNGDTLLDLDYRALLAWYAQQPEDLALVLRAVDDTARYGRVTLRDGRAVALAEKGASGPGLINAGAYVVRAEVFDRFQLAGSFSLEHDLLARHCAELVPRAFVTEAYFVDIGTPEAYERAERELPGLEAS